MNAGALESATESEDIVRLFREAFVGRKISLAYQPQVCLGGGRTLRWEVLSRWHDEKLGHVSPTRFMEVVSHLGWGRRYTQWLLKQALLDGRMLAAGHTGPFAFTFNLSPAELANTPLVRDICNFLESGLQGDAEIGVEITERQGIDDSENLIKNAQTLRSLGVKIGLDDFGAGYSRMQHLHELPLDFVKIDRSLITPLMCNQKSELVLDYIGRMAKDLGLFTVVEGVEEAEQAAWLMEHGFDAAQGYFFGHPAAADQIQF